MSQNLWYAGLPDSLLLVPTSCSIVLNQMTSLFVKGQKNVQPSALRRCGHRRVLTRDRGNVRRTRHVARTPRSCGDQYEFKEQHFAWPGEDHKATIDLVAAMQGPTLSLCSWKHPMKEFMPHGYRTYNVPDDGFLKYKLIVVFRPTP
jgi:hypothetical protein